MEQSRAHHLADRERRLLAALREVRDQIADTAAPIMADSRDPWIASRVASGQPLGGLLPRH